MSVVLNTPKTVASFIDAPTSDNKNVGGTINTSLLIQDYIDSDKVVYQIDYFTNLLSLPLM